MLLVERILGSRTEAEFAERLHQVAHHGSIDTLAVAPGDVARRRWRALTEAGEEVAIALPRDQKLFDGAILLLEQDRALVVRVGAEHWLRLQPRSIADAAELGYHAGNLHWRVRFEGESLFVALDGSVDSYLERLGSPVTERRVLASIADAD
jgi:urease accessory protein